MALEHLQKAEELNVSVADYCRTFEIDAKDRTPYCRISSDWTHLISPEWDHPISG
jgi:hypothetical protein